ncbi:Alpha/Beta hydrolase protein [Podospora fimiseda]|uniref:Alpha/Beta hydrolase protein n=1 Tax=Podospora fimiseda TaxID=252190 RepID=A0AAN7BGC7_9PEZI|nr:Alpha/Beta hydrolase protein [Podospora fimiseda]
MTTYATPQTLYTPSSPSGTIFAYRRFNPPSPSPSTTPLLILTHFRGTISLFDPLLLSLLSSTRPLIQVDYSGIGLSTGPLATSIKQSADHILQFLSLINEPKVDILGFSLGGMVAQLVALNSPPSIHIRKLILAGTTPSAGPEIQQTPNGEGVEKYGGAKYITVENFKVLFFPETKEGGLAAEEWWERIHEGGEDSGEFVSEGYKDGGAGLMAQSEQVGKWGKKESSQGEEGSFERLGGLVDVEVLVVNGSNDYMIPTVNSFVMQQRLPNAQLIIYPKSGHGAIFQYAKQFARDAIHFLSG